MPNEGAPAADRQRPPTGVLQLDPILSLALALHATRGGYALLLGSGVSRAAGIPTGWEVIEDLIRRVAAMESASAEADADPGAWYVRRFGAPPSYSQLLEALAKTPAERRELLRPYFEPTAAEQEEGLKRPTRAHRAIARLVAGGWVRVIVTTNFDQLLETALRDEGVVPAVVSSPDAVAGMMPLHLAPATIVKLHGDYLDVRIRNTPEELGQYEPAVNRVLDQIFDEYGLVVAGWSGVWDEALRAAVLRCLSRRFSTFWAARGSLAPEAAALTAHRRAEVIAVDTADAFFERLAEHVTTLTELARPHPLSTASAVASLKRYLTSPEHRIRLHDLIVDEAEQVVARATAVLPYGPAEWTEVVAAMPRLEAATTTLTALMAVGGYWGRDEDRPLWLRVLERLTPLAPAGRPRGSGVLYPHWDHLARYPAQLAFYAVGLGAVARGTPEAEEALLDLLVTPQLRTCDPTDSPERRAAAGLLNVSEILDEGGVRCLPGGGRQMNAWIAVSDVLFERLREPLRTLVVDDVAYADVFDRFEYLVTLAYAGLRDRDRLVQSSWVPVGRLGRRAFRGARPALMDMVEDEIGREGGRWLLLRRGLFEGSTEVLLRAKAAADRWIQGRPE